MCRIINIPPLNRRRPIATDAKHVRSIINATSTSDGGRPRTGGNVVVITARRNDTVRDGLCFPHSCENQNHCYWNGDADANSVLNTERFQGIEIIDSSTVSEITRSQHPTICYNAVYLRAVKNVIPIGFTITPRDELITRSFLFLPNDYNEYFRNINNTLL